jgi:uncharacterized membrane protein SirB2
MIAMDPLKTLHISCAAISIAGFVLRGGWMLIDSPLLQARLTRVLPHVVDTLLLGTGVALALLSAQYPFVHSWLTAKIVALVIYIGLGMVALKRGRTKAVRLTAFAGALLTFGYIVGVALTRSAGLNWS